MAVAGSAAPRASERAGVPGASRAAASLRASLSPAGGTRAAARGTAGPGGPGRRPWRGRAAGAQPARSPEPSPPLREPGEPRRGCPARGAPCRVRGETCPSQALHRPRLICKQRKVSRAPRALLPRPEPAALGRGQSTVRPGADPGSGARTCPRTGFAEDSAAPGAGTCRFRGQRTGRARAGVGVQVTQLHLARWGRRGASGNFGDGQGRARLERGCMAAMSGPDKRHSLVSARQP